MKYHLSIILTLLLIPTKALASDAAFSAPCHIEMDVVAKKDSTDAIQSGYQEVFFAISKCPATIAKANTLSYGYSSNGMPSLSDELSAYYLMFRDDLFQYSPDLVNAQFWTTDKKNVNKDRVVSYHRSERTFGYQYSFSTRGAMSTPIGYEWDIPSDYNFNTVDKRKMFPNRLLNSVVLGNNYIFFRDVISNEEFFQLANMLERGNYQVIFSVGEGSVVNK